MNSASPLKQLRAAIQADNDEAAERAVQMLTPADEPALLAWLNAGDDNQRWWAARTLAHCGGPDAARALYELLNASAPNLRCVAAFALGHLQRRAPAAVGAMLPVLAAHLSDEDGAVRQVVADALALCGDAAVPALANVIASQQEGARTRAAYALRKIASEEAIPVLFRCLNDPNYMVHTYAYEALDELGLLENVFVTH